MHITRPEQGVVLTDTTCVCKDSHTTTHGAPGDMDFGISEVKHVLATSTLIKVNSQNFLIQVGGTLDPSVTSREVVLGIYCVLGMSGAAKCTIEFTGSTIQALSTETRMSISDMAIQLGVIHLITRHSVPDSYTKVSPRQVCRTSK